MGCGWVEGVRGRVGYCCCICVLCGKWLFGLVGLYGDGVSDIRVGYPLVRDRDAPLEYEVLWNSNDIEKREEGEMLVRCMMYLVQDYAVAGMGHLRGYLLHLHTAVFPR